jgi:hypothetical protein
VLLKTWHNKKHYKYAEEPPTPEEAIPEGKRELQVLDARVHCAVLKKRTAPQPPARTSGERPRPATEDPGRTRFLRTQQRAHPGSRPASPVPRPEGNVLAGKKEKTQVNSQCSTRKHGRPATQTVTTGANAP